MHTVKSSNVTLLYFLIFYLLSFFFPTLRWSQNKTHPKKGNSNCCSLFFSKGLVGLRAHNSNRVFKKQRGTQMFTGTKCRGDPPTPKPPLGYNVQRYSQLMQNDYKPTPPKGRDEVFWTPWESFGFPAHWKHPTVFLDTAFMGDRSFSLQ